jgi:hypothetical protein
MYSTNYIINRPHLRCLLYTEQLGLLELTDVDLISTNKIYYFVYLHLLYKMDKYIIF